MSDYISREQVLTLVHGAKYTGEYYVEVEEIDSYMPSMQVFDRLHDALAAIPAANVREIKRCEDCRWFEFDQFDGVHWCNLHQSNFDCDAFCTYWEKDNKEVNDNG